MTSDSTVGRGVDNIIGYCGYVHNGESFIYTVRFRHYDAANGRWLERDPLGYIDSMGLYGYVNQSPLSMADPFGLYASSLSHPEGAAIAIGAALLALPTNKAVRQLVDQGIPDAIIKKALDVQQSIIDLVKAQKESDELAESVEEAAEEVVDELQELIDEHGGAESIHGEPADPKNRRTKGGVSVQIITVGGKIIHALWDKLGKSAKRHPHKRDYFEDGCKE